jgi:protein-tyrosine phosphatase
MIDIHSHILYGVDDGARTIEDSIDMLRMAADHDTTDIVATPHANSSFPFDPPLIASRCVELSQLHAGLPRIHRGCDFHLSAANIQLALEDPSRYTVNGGSYLMVELPELFNSNPIEEVFRQFTAKGVICVITHPERNPVLQKSPEILPRWVRNGCLSQLTAMSLTGEFGSTARAVAWQFLRDGHAHFVASDAHDIQHRTPRLNAARALIDREIGPDLSTLLFVEHPRAVIENLVIPMNVAPTPRRRKWFEVWKS